MIGKYLCSALVMGRSKPTPPLEGIKKLSFSEGMGHCKTPRAFHDRFSPCCCALVMPAPGSCPGAGFDRASSPSTSLCSAQDERGAGGLGGWIPAPVFTGMTCCRRNAGRLRSIVMCSRHAVGLSPSPRPFPALAPAGGQNPRQQPRASADARQLSPNTPAVTANSS